MHNLEFRQCDETSPYWQDVERLFQGEWSEFRFRDTYKPDAQLPPVIMVLSQNTVIGGLAYSYYQEPNQVADVIWINAVSVSPPWRGKGIASELICLGVSQVSSFNQRHLYVYTNLPSLYSRLGWTVVDTECEPNHCVMRISLASEPHQQVIR
ncbi:GNAT family N-acetyltransferase [Vibrio fluvialis]|uniref:GNAT family N-acetyltransferase n=1 Tax=Vibrio fluvialis TaxID=676 RepID=UPI001EEA3D90|nr:GNAT family N-acetyltransferase [Vibrio fluvialis]EKO3445282.1 GNAT family N-acetyltransferase [Vibrio fluvialis]ELG2962521.1 GNAT family N-acetyltransferase [Vibrio fluvialis]MCG6339916.1 GNAT family N-acetyltransferase [Vibrio fluvialis]